MMVMAMLVTAPLVVATGSFLPLAWPPTEVEFAVVILTICNIVAYGLFVSLISFAGAVFAAQVGYIVTLSGIVWGMLIYGEAHSLWIWGALLALMIGLALVKPRNEH